MYRSVYFKLLVITTVIVLMLATCSQQTRDQKRVQVNTVVPAVEWMFGDNADEGAAELQRTRALKKAAFAYAKATNNVPFFCRQPPSVPTVPKLDFFGRRETQENTGAQQEAGAPAAADAPPANVPGNPEAAQAEAGGRTSPPPSARGGRVRGRGKRGRRGRGRRALNDADTEEDADVDAEAGEQEALDRASSVCDRLRNLTARSVVIAHALLGDPEVVGTDGTRQKREKYFKELDLQCIEALKSCKIWLGGTTYAEDSAQR
jgi:hypothetical protein